MGFQAGEALGCVEGGEDGDVASAAEQVQGGLAYAVPVCESAGGAVAVCVEVSI